MVLRRKQSSADFFKQAGATAGYYGFLPLGNVSARIEQARKEKLERLTPIPNSVPNRSSDLIGSEFSKTIRACGEQGFLSRKQPTLFFHTTFDFMKKTPERSPIKTFAFGLHAYGANQSVGEAVVLKTALSILEELGEDNMTVYVNSIGDRDSKARFAREITAALRKRANDLPPQVELLLREDPNEAYLYIVKKRLPIMEELPRPVEFLSSASRRHFREVLEQLEAAGINFELDQYLTGARDFYSETIFDIRLPDEAVTDDSEHDLIVRGGRYDELPKRMFKLPLPVVGIIFALRHQTGNLRTAPEIKVRAPKVFFIHLGTEAKLHSLDVIEILRKAHIPFHHSIADSGFSEQVSSAERLGIPFLIIMGQKEAVCRSVIVRNISTRAQETVSIMNLPHYFRASRG
jgi:histidyl-tRNA synthetase